MIVRNKVCIGNNISLQISSSSQTKFVKNSHSHLPLKCFKTHPAISPSRPRDSISFEFKKKRNFTRRDAKDVIWRMENTHFTASRTNQILMEALMRGYSGRPEGTRKMKSGGEGSWRGERAALFLRARIILFFSFFSSLFFFFLRLRAAAFRRIFVSRPSSARPKQQLLLFLAVTFAILSSFSLLLSAAFSQIPVFPPRWTRVFSVASTEECS